MISIFDIYKIGIGPSSSHTMGPMKAANLFIDELVANQQLTNVDKITVDIYGSLSMTGRGHHTDLAIILGLAGKTAQSVDIDSIPHFIDQVQSTEQLLLQSTDGSHQQMVAFLQDSGLNFHKANLSLHENGLQFNAWQGEHVLHSNVYYSIGGGFVVDEANFGKQVEEEGQIPYPFNSAAELLELCQKEQLSISQLVLTNEYARYGEDEVKRYFAQVWQTMQECMDRGMNRDGLLPGPLKVPRRAASLYQELKLSDVDASDPMAVIDWVNMFAFAVNEENAAGGRVVTAPTNGACGIIPAVLAYYDKFIKPVTPEIYLDYFATSGAIGCLYKQNASISGAEVGCQGEVGVACSMAAAGLVEILGGTPNQVCIGAEIGMEHNLGLTCDPVAGQVQVPCIERNGIAAVKAINASRMAIKRTSEPRVSLDKVIETMLETGKDMNAKYRETSQGGLAVKVIC